MMITSQKQNGGRQRTMKISIEERPELTEMEVTVACGRVDAEVERLLSLLRVSNLQLTGSRGGQTYILEAAQVLYIDTADRKTFFYTKEAVYESGLRLYELEEKLAACSFLRGNKSCIVNFNQIEAVRSDLGGRLMLTMKNGERLAVSRQYAPAFKRKLEEQ